MPMDWEKWQKSRKRNHGSGGNNLPDFGNAFKNIKLPGDGRLLVIIPLVIIALWAASGFFTVAPAEVGLVKRFGQYIRSVEPGLNYRIPYPIEEVIKININRTNRVDIGGSSGASVNTMMLTKDENIADIRFVVQYRIGNPQDYAFNVFNPEKSIVDAATSAMREVIGRNTIDEALTEKRLAIQEDTMRTLQEMRDKYKIGVLIQNVELQDVDVPKEVSQSFRDVTSAKEDSVRSVNEAMGYANNVLPQARGEVFVIEAAAKAYSAERTNQAIGEAARFKALLAEYLKAPDITRRRLLLETMDKVLPKADKFILSSSASNAVLPHLGLKNLPIQAPAPEIRK